MDLSQPELMRHLHTLMESAARRAALLEETIALRTVKGAEGEVSRIRRAIRALAFDQRLRARLLVLSRASEERLRRSG